MAAATRREVEPDGTSAHGRVPWWARVFAYGFVALLLVFVFRDQEWWPLTSWHLFSHVRSDIARSYEVRSVGRDGSVRPLRFAGLPNGAQLENRLLPHIGTLPAARQRSTCDTWLKLAQQRGDDVVGLRIYAVQRKLPRGDGKPGALVAQQLRLACGEAS
jgi:hypothetical protein